MEPAGSPQIPPAPALVNQLPAETHQLGASPGGDPVELHGQQEPGHVPPRLHLNALGGGGPEAGDPLGQPWP